MDVPEIMLYGTTLVSPSIPVTVVASDHAATMSTPGAVKSGYTRTKVWDPREKIGINSFSSKCLFLFPKY